MSVIDVEPMVSAVSAEAPAGSDVEFDPAYFELEKLARGTPESVMGDEVKPAEEPEWRRVKASAAELMKKTRDLRVAMILTTALLQVDGVEGFREGLRVVRGLVEKLWDHFYPKLDPDDQNDPTLRVNILRGFDGDGSSADLYKLKQRLRAAPLTNSQQRIGTFGYRDIQMARGEIPPPPAKDGKQAKPPEMSLIQAAFEDTRTEDLVDRQTVLEGALSEVEGLDRALVEKIGAGRSPDFASIKDVLGLLKGVIDEQLSKRGIGNAAPADAGVGGRAASSGNPAAGAQGVVLEGEIASRTDVMRVLDKICEYYERFEPGSPVPIFMRRAKRLVTMSFVDVIKDLAPEAMQKIDLYTGQSAEGPTAPPA